MRIMPAFNPTSLPSFTGKIPTIGDGTVFNSGLTTGCGTLYFINKSAVGIYIIFDTGELAEIPAWWARPFAMKSRVNQIWLSQAYALVNASIASGVPISSCTIEVYQQTEDASGLYSGPINYQTSVGNPVATVGLSNFFDVTNPAYGAQGNGITDDTASIQAAISAAQAAGGGIVYFPVGVYIVHLTINPNVASIKAALHIPSNVSLWGDGPGASIIKLGAGQAIDQQQIISNWNPQASGTDMNICLWNIGIDGNALNNPAGASLSMCQGIDFEFVRTLLIDNVICKNNIGTTNGGAAGPSGLSGTGYQIAATQCADVMINNCSAYGDDGGQTSSGFLASKSFNIQVVNCTARDLTFGGGFNFQNTNQLEQENCSAYNLAGDGHTYNVVAWSHIANCAAGAITPPFGAGPIPASTTYPVHRGFVLTGMTDSDFVNCISYDGQTAGFLAQLDAGSAIQTARIRFANCQASNGALHGFQVISASLDISFANCEANGNTAGQGFLVTSTDTGGRFLFVNCRANGNVAGFRFDTANSPWRLYNCEANGNSSAALRNSAGTLYASLDGPLTAPAVPATTVALTSPFPMPMTVIITGGAVTVIKVNGTTTGLTAGTVRVPPQGTITLTYSSAPTWVWIAD